MKKKNLLFAALLLVAGSGTGAAAQSPAFNPEAGARYRVHCADRSLGYMVSKGAKENGTYLGYDTEEGLDQLVQFEQVADGTYALYFEDVDQYASVRGNGQAVNRSSNADGAKQQFQMVYIETTDGVDYYYFRSLDGGRNLYFSTDLYIRSDDDVPPARSNVCPGGYKLAIERYEGLITAALTQAGEALQALADTIHVAGLKDKLAAEAAKAEGTYTTQAEIDQLTGYLNALRTLAEAIQQADASAQAMEAGTLKDKFQAAVTAATASCTAAATTADCEAANSLLQARVSLADKIAEAQALYASGTEGTSAGQYPADARATFNAAIEAALSAMDGTDAAALGTALQTLDTALAAYKAAEVKGTFTPDASKNYVIRHHSNLVLTQAGEGNAVIDELAMTAGQQFHFVQVSEGVYNIASGGNLLLAKSGSYNTQWLPDNAENRTMTGAQFSFTYITDNYYGIQCAENSKYLGVDKAEAGSAIYSDKGGDNVSLQGWKFEEAGELGLVYTALEEAVAAADELYNSTEGGTGLGQYTGKDAFKQAIDAAKAVLDKAKADTATQEEVNAAVTALGEATAAYRLTEVTNDLKPGVYYVQVRSLPNTYLVWSGNNNTSSGNLKFTATSLDAATPFTVEMQMGEDGKVYNIYGSNDNGQTKVYWRRSTNSGTNSLRTASDAVSSSSYVKDFYIEWLAEDGAQSLYAIRTAARNDYLFPDGTELKGDKAGTFTDDDEHKFIFVKADMREILKTTIDEAKATLAKAQIGTDYGQYPQEAADALQTAIQTAEAVYNDEGKTDAEYSAARAALAEALDTFSYSIISNDLKPGKYYVQSLAYPSSYLRWNGETGSGEGNLKSDANSIEEATIFTVEMSQPGVYGIYASNDDGATKIYWRTGGGKSGVRMATDEDQASLSRDMTVTFIEAVGGLSVYNILSTKGYLICDGGTMKGDGNSESFTDSDNRKFYFIDASKRGQLQLQIANATSVKDKAVVGDGAGQVSQAALDDLAAAIAAAQAVYDDESKTDEEYTQAADVLAAALETFYSQVNSLFEDGASYRIYAKDSLAIGYLNVDGSSLKYAMKGLDATQLFRFELVPGSMDAYYIKNTDSTYVFGRGVSSGSNAVQVKKDFSAADASLQWTFTLEETVDGVQYYSIRCANRGEYMYAAPDGNIRGTEVANTNAAKFAFIKDGDLANVHLGKLIASVEGHDTQYTTKAGEIGVYTDEARKAYGEAIASAKSEYAAATDQQRVNAAFDALMEATAAFVPTFNVADADRFLIESQKNPGYLWHNGETAVVESNFPLDGWAFVLEEGNTQARLQAGDKVLNHELQMVPADASAADQLWDIRFTGIDEDSLQYYSFTRSDSLTWALALTSGGTIVMQQWNASEGAHQFHMMKEDKAHPRKELLAEQIAAAKELLDDTQDEVGEAHLQFPQAVRDSLQSVYDEAVVMNEAETGYTQQQVNDMTDLLEDTQEYYNKSRTIDFVNAESYYRLYNRSTKLYAQGDARLSSAALAEDTIQGGILWRLVDAGETNGYYLENNGRYLVADLNVTDVDMASATVWYLYYATTTGGREYYYLQTATQRIRENSTGMTLVALTDENSRCQFAFEEVDKLTGYVGYAREVLAGAEVGETYLKYLPAVYDTYKAVVDAAYAKALDAAATDKDATYDDLVAKTEAFLTAYNGYGMDYTKMQAAIDKAEGYLAATTVIAPAAGGCPQEAIDALEEAIAAAEGLSFDGLDQTGLDNAATTLEEATATFYAAMKEATGLQAAIDLANSLLEAAVEGDAPEQYEPGSKDKLQAAINEAAAVQDDTTALQAALLEAKTKLESAINDFEMSKHPALYLDDLAALIEEAEAFLEGKADSEYTDLRDKLAEAKALLASPTTQEEIDAVVAELEELLLRTGVDGVYNHVLAVFAKDAILKVQGLQEICDVKVFCLNGTLLFADRVLDGTFQRTLPAGTYVLSILGEHTNVNNIVIIK